MLIDLSRPVVYRSLDLNDAVLVGSALIGNHVTNIRYSGVDGVGYVEKKAGSDGMNASDVWQAGRNIIVSGITYGASRGDLSDRIQNLIAACTPRSAYVEDPAEKGFLPLQFFAPTARTGSMIINAAPVAQWSGGEIECFVRARPAAQPQLIIDRDASGGDDTDALALQWNVTFNCIDPRIYIAPRIDTVLNGVAGVRTNTIYNRGTYPAPLNFILAIGAAAGVATVSIAGAGTSMTLTIPNDPLARIVRISSIDQIVTSQLAGGEQTLALSFLNSVANRLWPYIQPADYATVVVTSDKTLDAGSLHWYYEALA